MGNYMSIKCPDIANGPGCRLSIFFSGCDKHCPGCFNEETWDFDAGKPFNYNVACGITRKLSEEPNITGITILGGEPLHPRNVRLTAHLLQHIMWYRSVAERNGDDYASHDIAIYTGYTFEELMKRITDGDNDLKYSIRNADILVDGPFIQELKDISLIFRGSSNQRILDSKASLEAGKAVLTTREDWLGKI